MKLAQVEYTGRVRAQTHRGVSSTTYKFSGDRVVNIENVRDGRQFESKPNFEVDWTAAGYLAKLISDESQDVEEAVSDLAYSAKKKLAGRFDDVNGSGTSEELNEALQEKAERLQTQMENQR
jgi:hypothetical protein